MLSSREQPAVRWAVPGDAPTTQPGDDDTTPADARDASVAALIFGGAGEERLLHTEGAAPAAMPAPRPPPNKEYTRLRNPVHDDNKFG